MEQGLARVSRRLILVVAASFGLMPVAGYGVAFYFGMLDPALLHGGALLPLAGLYAVLLGGMILHLRRYLRPLLAVAEEGEGRVPLPSGEHLAAFGNNYWTYFLLYVLLVPTTQHWLGIRHPDLGAAASLLQFMLLNLVVAVLVGLPGYLESLNLLGGLSRHLGLDRVQVGLDRKLLLVGAFLPALAMAAMARHAHWQAGAPPAEWLSAWALLSLACLGATVAAIRGVRQGLAPLHWLMHSSGASSHAELAQRLRPRSNDELGLLMQALSRLFRRLGEQDATVHAIVDNAAEGIIVIDEEGHIQLFNPAAERLFGYTAQEIRGRHLAWLLPDVARRLATPDDMEGEREVTYRAGHDEVRTLSVRVSAMTLDDGRYYVCLVSDISRRKETEERLREAESRYRNLVETAHDLVWSMDAGGRWTYLNRAATTIYGLPPEEMLGRHFSEFQAAESAQRDAEAFARLMAGRELVHYETVHLDAQGRPHHISFNARPIFDDDGTVRCVSGTARDISEQKAIEQELTYQAQHDTLTGLYNRKYFHQELNRVIARVARSGADCALFYIDLDQFKYINDTLGHAAGDQLLKECTRLLKRHIREGDLLARFGGDEFTVLLYNVDGSQAVAAAENLRSLFENFKFFYRGKTLNVTCTIGVALINNHAQSADDILAEADLACNVAKSEGRNRVHLYSRQDNEKAGMAEDMGWAARVRDACDHDRFTLVFQPIMSVRDDAVRDYETLLRMKVETGELLLPGGFMPAAERFGLIHNVDRWTVRHAIARLAAVRRRGLDVRFAINLSGRAMEDKGLVALIKDSLAEHAVPPGAVTFEITETAAIANLSGAIDFISSLREMGCQFALDDFGAGFCSFAYLKHLPVDKLKIDGSFVLGLKDGRVDQAMVQSMIQVAHALGKQAIAEFVEDAATLEILRRFEVDYVQGHFVGQPSDRLELHAKEDSLHALN